MSWSAEQYVIFEDERTRPVRDLLLGSASWYYELLRPLCSRVDVWRTTFYHPLSGGAAAIVEWFKGSGLRPFLEPLDAASRAAYLERYTAALARAYPTLSDGSVLLPFPRLFMVALRKP